MRNVLLNHASVFAASLAAVAGSALANDGSPLAELVGGSDLVFRGVVLDIEYALSEPGGPEQARIPYTFVTYRVDDVLQGEQPGLLLTLRFIGGFDRESLSYMSASILPQFDLGDEDILFVSGNNHELCPLVGNQDGRLRVIDGRVYSETGRAVTVDADDDLQFGQRFLLPQVMTTSIAGRVFETSFGSDASADLGLSDAIAADALAALIHPHAAVLAPAGAFEDADPALAIAAPDMTPAPPPAADLDDEGAVPDDELEEAKAAIVESAPRVKQE